MLAVDHWVTPDEMPGAPSPDGLDIWLIELESATGSDLDLLSEDERIRAERIVHEADRDRFIAVRGAVRRILSGYLGVVAESICFRTGAKGKPQLDMPTATLHFNLSHSHTLALLAVSGHQAVGVDLERVQPRPALRRIARKLFDESSLCRLEALPEEAFAEDFFRQWTALEARAKAVGEGVFTFRQSRTDILYTHFAPRPGWCAAVASAGPLPAPHRWRTLLLPSEWGGQIG